jgi:glycosyltransferase involved in cell wall biosynthesis
MLFANAMTTAKTLEELLANNDERFIQIAYQTLLDRAPDPEGMQYYLTRLRSGISKVEVLAQLRSSSEGKTKEIKIAGLSEAVKRHKQLKTPLLGSLMRLAGVKQPGSKRIHNQASAINTKAMPQSLVELIAQHGLDEESLPPGLTLEKINELNPHDRFDNISQALIALVQQSSTRKLRAYIEDKLNADFYVRLGLHQEAMERYSVAAELYQLSILFEATSTAHEHLGNIALNKNMHYQAISHYISALKLKSQSQWVYVNLARAQYLSGAHIDAVNTICDGINVHTGSDILLSKIDEAIQNYWFVEEQKIQCLAVEQNRNTLISEYERVTTFICESYSRIYNRNSAKRLSTTLNPKRVLIIGLTHDAAPQCFRYRISQKIEQLIYAGYEAETVAWHDAELALKKINFNDLIVFYRVPSFPGVLKLVEYAKSLNKITFFEVDDLLFEKNSVPAIETYGGQISLTNYINVTKDIGTYRSMATKCDYAIASTLPLIDKLARLTKTKIGYLHRNGLDKHNLLVEQRSDTKDYVNLFYGSGTLAHNTDFIIEALPAITQILREHLNVKLTIVGHLTLPNFFLVEFRTRVIQVPLVKDISAYWMYLSASDINLAVLHDDELTACKSELKWFEAAAFSIPSVVSRTQNYLDVIKQGEDGFVVFGQSEWYSTLKKLIENPKVREKIGSNAFARVKKEYSIDTLSKNIDLIFKNALKHHYSKIAVCG